MKTTTKKQAIIYNNKDIWQPIIFTLLFGMLVFIGGVSPIPFGVNKEISHEIFLPFTFVSMAFINQKQVRWYLRFPFAAIASTPFLLGLMFCFQVDYLEYSQHTYSAAMFGAFIYIVASGALTSFIVRHAFGAKSFSITGKFD